MAATESQPRRPRTAIRFELDSLETSREEAIRDREELTRRLDEAIAERNALREQVSKLESERRRTRPHLSDPGHDRPIGNRELTAAELLAATPSPVSTPQREWSPGERTATRLFGGAACACAVLLVVNLLPLVF